MRSLILGIGPASRMFDAEGMAPRQLCLNRGNGRLFCIGFDNTRSAMNDEYAGLRSDL